VLFYVVDAMSHCSHCCDDNVNNAANGASGTVLLVYLIGNPVASLITKLRLDKNRIIIRLPDILADSDSDEDEDASSDEDDQQGSMKTKVQKTYVDVDLDLGLSAYANASKLYSQRKVAHSKEQKTAVAAERAIKAVNGHLTPHCCCCLVNNLFIMSSVYLLRCVWLTIPYIDIHYCTFY